MQTEKLRTTTSNGLVPAGQFFKLVAEGLRDASDRGERRTQRERRAQTPAPLAALQ